MGLVQDPSVLKPWESSDALIQFFQSKLSLAYTGLTQELSAHPENMTLKIALSRVTLELIETLDRVELIERELLSEWISYELSRPRVGAYKPWYAWIELASIPMSEQSSPRYAERVKTLTAQVKQSAALGDAWVKFALDVNAEVPSAPTRPKAAYQRWVRFARAISQGDLKRAHKLSAKLKLKAPMLSLPATEDTQDLKVFDPRVTRSLKALYVSALTRRCEGVPLGSYYCGRAYEISGARDQALAAYKRAISELDALVAQPESARHTFDHLVLSAHLSFAGLSYELESRITRLGGEGLGGEVMVSAERTPHLYAARNEHERASVSAELWRRLMRAQGLLKPEPLFPQRKAELSESLTRILGSAEGPGQNLVFGIQLPDRWLDEQHYLYARALTELDDRPAAIKALNAVEDARLGHLPTDESGNGHNRLKRLLLSAHLYLKMNHQRITLKYLRRLHELFPTLSFALEMTSDVLSGKSLEQNNGQSNSGQ